MSENLEKILKLEEQIGEMLIDDIDTTNVDLEKKVLKLRRLLEKIDNNDLLYLFSYSSPLHKVVNLVDYFKKYNIDKKELEENKSYKEEFENLSKFVEKIRYVAINEEEYLYICYKCDVDNAAAYLLEHMSNSDIMELSNNSTDWDYKLFLFGNLKE